MNPASKINCQSQVPLTCLVDQNSKPSLLSQKIDALMRNASNISHHQLNMFLKTHSFELSVLAIYTPSNWLLFSQCMQRQFTTKSKVARLLNKLNLFIKKRELIKCNPVIPHSEGTFSQIFPTELRRIFAFTTPPSFQDNSATLEKMRLILLEDKPPKDFFNEIKGIPVKDLADWINLYHVPIHTLKITEAELNLLLPKLEYVDLGGYKAEKIPSLLTKLKKAKHISCNHVTDYSLQIISTLKFLTSLNLSNSKDISDEGLENLAELSGLTCLDLSYCDQITDDGMEHLKPITNLIYLNISDCTQLTDITLDIITVFTKLESLEVMGCNEFTDEGLANLIILGKLTHLNISDCNHISGVGLESLNPDNRLSSLELSHCNEITDADLKIIGTFTNLKWLKLNGCTEITDDGIEHLKTLTLLKHLMLTGCTQITEQTIESLQKILTQTAIDY